MNAQALWYFEGLDIFGKFCPLKLEGNEKAVNPESFKSGDVIYIPRQKAKYIHVIVQGRVKIGHYLDDGKEATQYILAEGEVFGELGLAGEEERNDFAEVLEDNTLICQLELEEIRELMLHDADMSLRIMKWMGRRMQKLERKIESLAFRDARTRIIEFLKDAAAWKGTAVGTETMIKTNLTHQEIATLTATSRQTVSEVLNSLRNSDQIYFERGKILIRELESLK
jgi:CRP-like cAMP-binding protein